MLPLGIEDFGDDRDFCKSLFYIKDGTENKMNGIIALLLLDQLVFDY